MSRSSRFQNVTKKCGLYLSAKDPSQAHEAYANKGLADSGNKLRAVSTCSARAGCGSSYALLISLATSRLRQRTATGRSVESAAKAFSLSNFPCQGDLLILRDSSPSC